MIRLVCLCAALLLLVSCGPESLPESSATVETNKSSAVVTIDLPEIHARDTLRAIVSYSSTSYFIYRGQPMGYEYELLERLAERLNLPLAIVIADNLDSLESLLFDGRGDIIAHGLTITAERRRRLAFTTPHTTTHQVLVQRKPADWRDMKRHEIDAALIRSPLDLIGRPVHVRKNSSYYERLLNLSEEMGGDIEIVPAAGDLETEELIRMVARGEIDYTVADHDIAHINETYHPILDVETAVSFPQRIAWAVRPSSPKLLAACNAWIDSMKQTTDYHVVYNKYFKNRKAFRRRAKSEYFSRAGGGLSPYDSLIQVHALALGWDWRLLAALIYQESRFDPRSQSWAGAGGLMQMMPATAKRFGADDSFDPVQNLRAGTAYLEYLWGFWDAIGDSLERMKFVLASYNAGENHIADARRLAAKHGADPVRWDGGVDEYILLKSKRAYYSDEVVKYGYCRGEEPYEYVAAILKRYDHYRRLIAAAD